MQPGGWFWGVYRSEQLIKSGPATDNHLAKTYAMRAAMRILKSLGR